MDQVTARLATSDDLTDLADLWYENRVLQQQSDSRLALTSGAKIKWIEEASRWLMNPRCAIWAALRQGNRQGYLILWLQDMPPGVVPACVGYVSDMAVDLHSPSGGAGQILLSTARDWLTQQGIENMMIAVPHRQPVQQAFWRGQGARTWMDLMWLKL
ncbi:MAG: GNAT family N-acetyltransferase [Chloroflexota bacterium]